MTAEELINIIKQDIQNYEKSSKPIATPEKKLLKSAKKGHLRFLCELYKLYGTSSHETHLYKLKDIENISIKTVETMRTNFILLITANLVRADYFVKDPEALLQGSAKIMEPWKIRFNITSEGEKLAIALINQQTQNTILSDTMAYL